MDDLRKIRKRAAEPSISYPLDIVADCAAADAAAQPDLMVAAVEFLFEAQYKGRVTAI